MITMKGKNLSILLVVLLFFSAMVPFLVSAVKAQTVPNGPMVDEIDFFAEKDYAKVVNMLKTGDMDIYLSDISDPEVFQTQIKPATDLMYKTAYGLYDELTFNPVGPTYDNGELNPFSDAKIREAMNYIIDRNYIVNEIYKGLAKPKFTILSKAFPEYARLADEEMLIESKYAYNFEKGKEIIFEEMSKLGANFVNGKWYYNGNPVDIKFLIRTEDARKDIGNYVADQLEKLGFTVDRMYKTSREASPLWLFGNPADGQWTMYTGAWITLAISRDQSSDFSFFYTSMGLPFPLWQAYHPDPIFYDIAAKLAYGKWKTWDERTSLMKKALELSMKDSVRIFLVDQLSPYVMRKDVNVAVDLASAFNNPIWGMTIQKGNSYGGVIKAGNREVLVDPWNPVAGTNWVYDVAIEYIVEDFPYQYNPYTGLIMPNNFKTAEVDVPTGSPVIKSSDWLALKYTNGTITVPSDAFYAYNPVTDSIENPPVNTTAKVKVTINYGDVIGKVKYHDGTVMTLADFYLPYLLRFARANNASPWFDKSSVPDFDQWRSVFKGFKIVSEHPLVVEYYYDYLTLEAEDIVSYVADWPTIPWHVYAIGMIAEKNKQLAFSADKADALGVEWMNYIGGPSLPILANSLTEAMQEKFVPFSSVLSQYISSGEVEQRYQALQNWYNEKHHFFVANGPFYLDHADFTGHQAIIKAFREYQHKADTWAWLSSPPVPESEIKVPQSVVPGMDAKITVNVFYKGKSYPSDKIDYVEYLITDSANNILFKGEATNTGGSTYEVDLNSTQTGTLKPGSYKVTTIVVSKLVGMPGIKEETFIVIPELSYFQTLVSSLQNQLNSKISVLETSLDNVTSQVNSMRQSLTGINVAALTNLVYASLVVAIISILIALAAVYVAMKK